MKFQAQTRRSFLFFAAVLSLVFSLNCASDPNNNALISQSGTSAQVNKGQIATSTPPPNLNDSIFSEANNQMSVAELRQRLDEVKSIESEARMMASLRSRGYWEQNVAECMKIMGRLKPRAAAIQSEYKRMLSPSGTWIASAAINLVGCINCVEGDSDDCSYARSNIKEAEKELKKEMRQ